MNLLKSKYCLIVVTVIFGLTSCSTTQVGQQYSTPQQSHQLDDLSRLTDRERADLYEAIIAADLADANGEYEIATSYYLAAARLSNNIDLIKLSVESAKKSHDGLAVLQASELWLAQSPNNLEAITLRVDGLLENQELEQAITATQQFFELETDPLARADLLTQSSKNKTLPIANAYLAKISEAYPASVAALYAQADFLSGAAKHTKAPESIMKQAFSFATKALALKGDFLPAIELKTRLYYRTRQDEKAEAMLRALQNQHPNSSEINQLLGQLLYDLRKYDLAKQHYISWLNRHPKDKEARFFLAATNFAISDYSSALANYKQVIGSDYKPQLSYFFCGSSASQIKDFEQAIRCYEKVESGQYLTRSKIELAKLYALDGKISEALAVVRNPNYATDENEKVRLINIEIEILNQYVDKELSKQRLAIAMKNYPDNLSLLFKKIKFEKLIDHPKELIPLLHQAEEKLADDKTKHPFNLTIAGFLRNNGLYQEAVDWLNTALIAAPGDKDYMYARALYKEPLGLVDEMISEFKHLLTLDPNNVNIKNALGYTLADVNQELDYAGQLIDQAYMEMPKNAAVIDSKGWLAYRKGSLERAIKYLHLAFKLSPSADVAVHIGEVYWQKGEKDKARFFWNKAKSMDKKNFLLGATIKKFGVSLSN